MAGLGAKCVNWSLKDLHHYIFTLKLVAISLLEGVFLDERNVQEGKALMT